MSDVVLFRRNFIAMHRSGHFTSMPIDSFKSVPAPCELPPEVEAILFRSIPVSCEPERFIFQSGYLRYVPRSYDRYYIDLSISFETYLKQLSSKSRATLLRKVKKFSALPGAHWRTYRSASELLEFIDIAKHISVKTYQHKHLAAGLPESQEFRHHAVALGDMGSAIGAILFNGNDPVSYVFCPAEYGILLYEYVGYDPRVRNLSPGMVLQYHLLEGLFRNQEFRFFDFTEGEGQHKALFATHSIRCADVYYFRRSTANLIGISSHAVLSEASLLIGKIAEQLGVKAVIRRFLRR
jgi:Acetyltransferase (GNAT) domain